jgi:SAM-dependent methyltransferase
VADAAALPFAPGQFALVVAYNSLMDMDDLPGAVREAARVLAPGGRLGICVPHSFGEAGSFVAPEADAPFVIDGSYLGRRRFEAAVVRNGATMRMEHIVRWSMATAPDHSTRALSTRSVRPACADVVASYGKHDSALLEIFQNPKRTPASVARAILVPSVSGWVPDVPPGGSAPAAGGWAVRGPLANPTD